MKRSRKNGRAWEDTRSPALGEIGSPFRRAGSNLGIVSNKWFLAAVLTLVVFLVYQPAWHGTYLWDDDTHLLDNPVLRPGGFLRTWTPGTYANYWPVTATVYRLEFELWGFDPLGYHLVNIALHALSTVLLWRILIRLQVPGGFLAAAIFALHPVNVESVAWITQLKNTLSLALALGAVLLYLRHGDCRLLPGAMGSTTRTEPVAGKTGTVPSAPGTASGNWQFAASLALFLLSLLAKGMTLTLPLVLLVLAWWQRGAVGWRDLLRTLPFFLIAALMTGMEVFQQHYAAGGLDVRSDGLLSRVAVAGCAVWFYLWKAVWPVNLIFVYPRWDLSEPGLLKFLPGVLLVVILAVAWHRRRSWGRPVVTAIVCYIVLLLPALGFVNIFFMLYSLVADHWQYAALTVFCVAAAGALTVFAQRFRVPPPTRVAFCLFLLTTLAVQTFRQSRMYADIETLYRTTLERNPECWLFRNNLGNLLSDRGDFDAAIEQYEMAIKTRPEYADAEHNFGVALGRQNRTDEAIAHFEEAVRLNSDWAKGHRDLAKALARQEHITEAIQHFRRALEIDQEDVETLNDFAWLLATHAEPTSRDGREAIKLAQKALLIAGPNPKILDTLAAAYAENGQFADAQETARKAATLARSQHQLPLADRITARLRLYQSQFPYREH
jgi:protein O-mannosyl-transferase